VDDVRQAPHFRKRGHLGRHMQDFGPDGLEKLVFGQGIPLLAGLIVP